ncbi:MAG: peptidoglycan-binding domain-containing protein [Pseudomonadota bacterium]
MPMWTQMLTLALGLMACTIFASAATAGVIGRDSREPVTEYADLARSVGLVFDASRARPRACTAFCVGLGMIATNAHCLVGDKGRKRRINLSNVKFAREVVPGLHMSSALQHANSWDPRLSLFAGFYNGARRVGDFASDWAFAKLDTPICRNAALEFATPTASEFNKLARTGKLFMIAYHGDRQMTAPLLSKDCRLLSARDRRFLLASQRRTLRRSPSLFLHTCDSAQGSSGAPIFAQTTDGPKVVAINAGEIGVTRRTWRGRKLRTKETRANIALRPVLPLQGLSRFRKEQVIADEARFVALQTLLADAGLYSGAIDGLFGKRTRAAIQSYERQRSWASLGMPTEELIRSLEADAAARTGATATVAELLNDAAQGQATTRALGPARVGAAVLTPGADTLLRNARIGSGDVDANRQSSDVPRPAQRSSAAAGLRLNTDRTIPPLNVADQDLALDLQTALARLGCYDGALDGVWGPMSQAAAQRYHRNAARTRATTNPARLLSSLRRANGTVC